MNLLLFIMSLTEVEVISLIVVASASLLVVCLLILRKVIISLEKLESEKEIILNEEKRLFDFLHRLGCIIESDTNPNKLHKEIVEGFIDVLKADGGVLYLLSEDRLSLIPKYISSDCPPLVGIPVEIRHRSKKNPKALESYVRLAKVAVEDGVLGAVLAKGECLNIPDVKYHEAFRDGFVRYDGDIAALLAPLHHAGKDLGVIGVVKKGRGREFSKNDFEVFQSISEQAAFAMGNAMIHRELTEKRKMDDELRMAREVQEILLPSKNLNIPGYRVFGMNKPARMISGDYFDYIKLPGDRSGVVIADVTGKGVPAGLLMAMCRSVLRISAEKASGPSEALAQVNRYIFPDVKEDMFISLAYVVIENGTGNLCISRAGHDEPMMFRSNQRKVESIKPPGLAIGIDAGNVFERVTKDLELKMESGDCLLLYTDGVCEAVDKHGNEFGAERLEVEFLKAAPMGAEAIVESIRHSVDSFVGALPQMDDITIIVIEKK